jgi:hypothetical protein
LAAGDAAASSSHAQAYALVSVFLDFLPAPPLLLHVGAGAGAAEQKAQDSYMFCLRALLSHDKFRQAMLCPLHANALVPVSQRLHTLMLQLVHAGRCSEFCVLWRVLFHKLCAVCAVCAVLGIPR